MFSGFPQINRHRPAVFGYLHRASRTRVHQLGGSSTFRPMLVMGLALLVFPITASAFAADEEPPVVDRTLPI